MNRPFRKKLNHRLLEYYRCYSVSDLAELFDTNQQTVLKWIIHSLRTIDSQKPYLVFGADMIAWIKRFAPKKKHKSDLKLVYCVKCRDKVLFDYKNSWVRGNQVEKKFLQSRCPSCQAIVNKVLSKKMLSEQTKEKGLVGSTHLPVKHKINKEKDNAPIQCKKRAGQIPLFGDADLWKNE